MQHGQDPWYPWFWSGVGKWWFPEIGVPPKHPFLDGIFPHKPTILGILHLWKPLNVLIEHHPTLQDIVSKAMFEIPKTGPLPALVMKSLPVLAASAIFELAILCHLPQKGATFQEIPKSQYTFGILVSFEHC